VSQLIEARAYAAKMSTRYAVGIEIALAFYRPTRVATPEPFRNHSQTPSDRRPCEVEEEIKDDFKWVREILIWSC
jgi:hypothetical protein